MKVRTFRKCINRGWYKRVPKYACQILGIGLGEDTRYKYKKMRAHRNNGRWIFELIK